MVEKLEKMSVADARHAVDFAEVVVLLLDATSGLEQQDLKIASMVLEEGRALMIAINKWDVAEDAIGPVQRHSRRARRRAVAGARACRCSRSRRKTGKGLDTMLAAAFELREAWSRRVPTAALNRWFDDALEANPAARARRQADQAALHHPDQDPPAAAS